MSHLHVSELINECDSAFGNTPSSHRSYSSTYRPITPVSENHGRSLSDYAIPRKPVALPSTENFAMIPLKESHQPKQTRAQLLQHEWVWDSIISAVLMALPLPFFIYAGIALHLNNHPVNDQEYWKNLRGMGEKLATLFPIIFALVLARTLKKTASWRLERGTNLGYLEQMMGSLTVGSTISSLFLIRRFNLLTIALLCSWALSPIGSQANLQVLNVQECPVQSSVGIEYFNSETTPGIQGDDTWWIPALDSLFASSLMSPASIRKSSMDLWGNVKIPDISRLTANNTSDKTSFIHVPVDTDVAYSSILGIPLSKVPDAGNTTFHMEASYIALDCIQILPTTTISWKSIDGDGVFMSAYNRTLPTGTFYGLEKGDTDKFYMALENFYPGEVYGSIQIYSNDTSPLNASTLIFQSLISKITAFCVTSTAYIESIVSCVGRFCSVTAMRPSQLHHPNANRTNLQFIGAFELFTSWLTNTSYAQLIGSGSSALELYLDEPDLAQQAGSTIAQLQDKSLMDFGIRLQQVINTYWYGSYDPALMMGGIKPNVISSGNMYRNETATNVVWQETYTCNIPWAVFAFLSTGFMFLVAVLGAVLNSVNRGPEVLGHCVSLLRDTPYARDAQASSAIGGSKRSRKFQELRVRLADVESEREVGYIAVTEDSGGMGGGRLTKGRLYR